MLLSNLAVDASLSAPAAPLLLINDLHFAYPDGRVALRGVRLRIARGEKVALVGPNGAGKSTLLLHLNGILRGKGRIEVAGMQVDDHTLPQVRARVGLVFQIPTINCFRRRSSKMWRSVRCTWGLQRTRCARESSGR